MDNYVYDLDVKRKTQYKKVIAMLIGILLVVIATFLILAEPVYASPVVQVEDVGSNYIEWNFSEPVEIAIVDGKNIPEFNSSSETFILSGLDSESKHSIQVINLIGESGFNSTKTLPIESKSIDKIGDFILEYILLIAAILCFVVGFKIPIVGLMGTVFSVMGIVSALPKGNFYLDLIFGIGIFAGATITYLGVER
jgi:hypothetical protein